MKKKKFKRNLNLFFKKNYFQTQQSLSLTGDEESKEKTTETPTDTEKESLANNETENKDQVIFFVFVLF